MEKKHWFESFQKKFLQGVPMVPNFSGVTREKFCCSFRMKKNYKIKNFFWVQGGGQF